MATTRHRAGTRLTPGWKSLADLVVDFAERHRADLRQESADLPVDDPVAMALLLSRSAGMPPAWERLDQLCHERARARGLTVQLTAIA